MLKKFTQLMTLGLVGSFVATAAAQDSGALIDALVRKGVLKDQEAEQIRAQMVRDFSANTSAGKLNLSSSIKELKLSGDVRGRWQYDQQQNQDATNTASSKTESSHDAQRSRYRLRLRINADYQLSDNFFAGFGLQTESKSDSGNQTMAESGLGSGFQNYNLYVSKAYLGWTPIPGVTAIVGKQANPFYTTDLIWDADINPTGFVERLDLHKFLSLGDVELSLIAGQFTLQDNKETLPSSGGIPSSGGQNRDTFLHQIQVLASARIAEGVKLTVAPGIQLNNGGVFNATSAMNEAPFVGGTLATNPGFNQGFRTLDKLMVVLLPGDVSTTLLGQKFKLGWDFAYNTEAAGRSKLYKDTFAKAGGNGNAFVNTPSFTDKAAWLAGFQLGENKKKGDWSLLANYRRVGLDSIDPNINDSDWSLSKLNMAGFKVGFVYNLGDAATIGLTYYQGNNIRQLLSVPTVADRNSVQVIQLDAVVKF